MGFSLYSIFKVGYVLHEKLGNVLTISRTDIFSSGIPNVYILPPV